MTAKELAALVGVTGSMAVGGVTVNVKVLDVKESYGRLRYQVTPLSGSGVVWTEGFQKSAISEDDGVTPIRRVG